MKAMLSKPLKAKCIILSLAVIAFVSICANIVLYCHIGNKRNVDVLGTYCCGEQVSEDAEYFAIMKKGKYVWYRQFEKLDEGQYIQEKEEIYSLQSDEENQGVSHVWFAKDRLFHCDSEGEIEIFEKISDMPGLINVQS